MRTYAPRATLYRQKSELNTDLLKRAKYAHPSLHVHADDEKKKKNEIRLPSVSTTDSNGQTTYHYARVQIRRRAPSVAMPALIRSFGRPFNRVVDDVSARLLIRPEDRTGPSVARPKSRHRRVNVVVTRSARETRGNVALRSTRR